MDVSFNGETYTVVDDSTIDGEISDGNVNLITTFVTNMDGLFENSTLNKSIKHWDFSNVTSMKYMFKNSSYNRREINYITLGNHDISLDDMFAGNDIRYQYGNGDVIITNGTPTKEWFYERIESTPSSIPQQTFVIYASNGITLQINPFYPDISSVESANGNSNEVTFNGVTYTVVTDSDFHSEISGGNYNLITTFVTNMNSAFNGDASFNSDISNWDTSNVTTMENMFYNASSFNQDIGNWDTSNLRVMYYVSKYTI